MNEEVKKLSLHNESFEFAKSIPSVFQDMQTFKEEKETYGIEYLIQFQKWKGGLINEVYKFATRKVKVNFFTLIWSFLDDITEGTGVLSNIQEMILEIQDLDEKEKDTLDNILRESITQADPKHEDFIAKIDRVVNDVIDLIIEGRQL